MTNETTTEEARTPGQEPSRMAEGCCSAVSPCSHQQRDPYSLCDICLKANGLAERISAAPRANSAEKTAGERAHEAYYVGIWRPEWSRLSDDTRQRWEAAAKAMQGTTPAPSSPGVPDSVRAFFDWVDHQPPKPLTAAVTFRAGWDAALASFPTHPAGQSTGQGADEAVKRFAHAVLHGDDEHRDWLTEAAECFVAGKPIPEPRGKGTQQPAPDSTRTGQVGVEEPVEAAASVREVLRKAVSKPLHDNQFLDDWNELVDPVVDAVLAARPAAPEAQGAWRPMSEAPKDGTWILGWQADTARYGGKPANVMRWFDGMWTGWTSDQPRDPSEWMPLPAPPASSGQESA